MTDGSVNTTYRRTGNELADDQQDDARFDDQTDGWLVDASRRLEPPARDLDRLITSITSGIARVRRPARALATDHPGVSVSDRVVKQLVATRVRAELGRLVVFAAVDGSGDAITSIRLGLMARYRDDLLDDADQVREVVSRVLIATLGVESSAAARDDIAVRWQDLYTRDWIT
ncbi:hypothetical protein GCM10009624_12900 [Gordonia sinesedis]